MGYLTKGFMEMHAASNGKLRQKPQLDRKPQWEEESWDGKLYSNSALIIKDRSRHNMFAYNAMLSTTL